MKFRFPILFKVVLLGIGVSILTAGAAILVSYYNNKNTSKANLINSIDNSIDEVEYFFTEANGQYNYLDDLKKVREYIEPIYRGDTERKTQSDFSTFQEFVDWYANMYPLLYPVPQQHGFVPAEEADFRAAYSRLTSILVNAQISSGCRSAFLAFYDEVDNNLVIISDSRTMKPNYGDNYYQVPGSFYTVKPTDYQTDENYNRHYAFVFSGYHTRFDCIYDTALAGGLKVVSNIFIEYNLQSVYEESRRTLNQELLILGLSSLFLVVIYALSSYFLFVKNINKLSRASEKITKNLVDKNMNEIVDVEVKSNDEMKTLANSFVAMERAIINYVDIINQEAEEKERTNAELSVASKIQLDSLPSNKLEDKNTSLRAFIKTAKEVGGDFYDYFYLDDHRLVVLISDVSGKGIPASLFMMKGKELIKSALQSYTNLCDAINGVNNMLARNNNELLFITSFIGVIDFEKNEIRYINAGHEKPYIVSNNKVIKLVGESNIVLGVEQGHEYKEESHEFNKGDYLFMFTDGLNESINSNEEEFGYPRVEEALSNTSGISLDEVTNKVITSLDAFIGKHEQFDDVTMLIVKNKTNELKLHYDKKEYEIIEDITNKFNDAFSFLNSDTKSAAGIIIDEVVNNFISYEKKEDLEVDVTCSYENDVLKMEISSNGDDYNPFDNHKEKFLKEYHSEIELGGFGLSLIKKLSKTHKYEYRDGHPTIIVTL